MDEFIPVFLVSCECTVSGCVWPINEMEGDETLYLKWNQFGENLKQSFTELRNKSYFFDVTLACEDKEIKVHKLILSACSPLFRRLLLKKSHQQANVHPLIYLSILDICHFVYTSSIFSSTFNTKNHAISGFFTPSFQIKLKNIRFPP